MPGKVALALSVCTLLSYAKSNNDATPTTDAAELKGFGVIREFGGTDTAAMFGLLPSSGSVSVTAVRGPQFLGAARVGTFNQAAMDHLFLKSAKPMAQDERQNWVSTWNVRSKWKEKHTSPWRMLVANSPSSWTCASEIHAEVFDDNPIISSWREDVWILTSEVNMLIEQSVRPCSMS